MKYRINVPPLNNSAVGFLNIFFNNSAGGLTSIIVPGQTREEDNNHT